MRDLDPVRALLIARMAATGHDAAGLSRKIKKNPAYIQQFLRRGIPATLPEDVRESLAPLLQVSPDTLRGAIPGKGGPREVDPAAVAATPDEQELLRVFRSASERQKEKIIKIIAQLVD